MQYRETIKNQIIMEPVILNEFTFETPDGCRYACKQAFTQDHVFICETIRQIG